MTKHIIAFSCVTYANKAKAVFVRNGIPCEIKRTPANLFRGCGYGVVAEGAADTLVRLLEENGVSYRTVSRLG